MAIDMSCPETKLRLVFDNGLVLGPGKVALLQAISETGSIAAAARCTAISYRKTRHLIDALNGAFDQPLVLSSKGGAAHGGARLTPLGLDIIARYRRVEQQTRSAVDTHFGDLKSSLTSSDDETP
ncbi:winged helix-turn-helix domain-containing protein [Kushneria phyllosphaerae]|uniref:Molybdenum-pterin-binding protein MopA n=1 Tax=Kushneria phyllosphaerae TaxID=2100822 RepID=A0A2R8CLV0_9GAMM|nr:winged helix-turn-helix domain-containing protein [Kushneria phyllosphaerae]SPJ33875.1 Molybdenum-pterin-binding protein MopA [Kushneria phyllosphaerae]